VLRHLAPERVASSDLVRACATARALGELTGQVVHQDERFRETFAGAWQGLTFAEIAGKFAAEHAAWRAGDPHLPAGGGENRTAVGSRMAEATLEAVGHVRPGGTLVVVSHGGAIRAGLAALMGFPAQLWGALSGVANCHWSVLEEQTVPGALFAWQLTEHNIGLASMPSAPLEG
jgi:broad specificity phosphatase PhoE